MVHFTLILVLLAVATAVTIKPLKNLDSGLSEVSKADYEAARAGMRNANPQSVSFIDQQQKEEDHGHHQYHYSKKQRKMINEAKTADQIMYGGQLFKPGPGHDMYFNFAEFSEFAHAHTELVRRQVAKVSQKSYSNTSSHGLTTSDFFMGCIEVNLCAAPPTAKNAADSCGMFGFDGSVTLETKEGKQTLTLSASASAGIAFHLLGSAMTVYITGGVEWEFEITGQAKNFYTSSYEAFLGCLKYYIGSMASRKLNLNDKFLEAAKNSRLQIAAANKAAAIDGTPQQDELTGLVKIHYKFLTAASTALASVTGISQAQTALKKAVVKAVWGTDTATITAAQAACPSKGKPVDEVLMCTILANAPLLPSNEQDTNWVNNPKGSDANFQNGFPVLYKEIWPTTEEQVAEIKKDLSTMVGLIAKIQPADWAVYTPLVSEADGKQFTSYIKAPTVTGASEEDPCITARAFFQYLSVPASELAKAKFEPPNSGGVQFHSKSITLTGTVGATFGKSSVGYCTADENMFQLQIATQKVYNTETGEWEGGFWGRTKLWTKIKLAPEAPFFLETSLQLKAKEEDDALTAALIFSVPPEAGEAGLEKKLFPGEAFLNAAPYVTNAVGGVLTAFQGLNSDQKAASKGAMQEGLKAALSKTEQFKQAMTALGLPINQGFFEGIKGLGAKVGTAALKAAALGLLSNALGAKAEKKTIIEVGLEVACKGVTTWKHCIPKVGPAGAAEIALTLGVSITKVFLVKVANNTFYLEFGNNVAYEWTLKEKAELEK